mmetsp:Transcript_87947/g.273343  ORF Transcript_87947/g.273343 Transcript_87947/m.273343 type:complete len:364 (-) Transcript_87947:38-1129(-)
MHAKGTPSKARRPAEFQRTPRPLPRRSFCGSSPAVWEQGTPLPPSPLAVPPAAFSPQCCAGGRSPSCLGGLSPCGAGALAASRAVVMAMPSSSSSTPKAAASLSTPSKIITISTPLRPCSRQKAKEMQDDVKAALEEQSAPLLRVALQRRHACPGEHALHEAVRQAHVPAVRLLLQGRAEPNARCLYLERGCEFPLQLAASCTGFLRNSDRLQAVDLLLRAGARPGPRRGDAEANTPLHDAVRRADLDLALLLLRSSADPNAVNGFGEAPLQLALRPGVGPAPDATPRALAEALLEAGACPLVVGDGGRPPTVRTVSPDLRALLAKWSAWWRCRTLAWVRSRGRGQPLSRMPTELLAQVARFL